MRLHALNIGVLGGASIARRYVLPAIQAPGSPFALTAIGSRSLSNAEGLVAVHGGEPEGSYEAVLAREDLDAVYIPLPTGLHSQWISSALERGLHVLCEKSLTTSLDATATLCNLARERGLALVENFQFRCHPQLSKIKQVIQSGRIGELRSINVRFGMPPFSDEDNIRYSAELGGGSLLDAGAYPVRIIQELLGHNVTATSASLFHDKRRGVDIWGGGVTEVESGANFCSCCLRFRSPLSECP
ncbi:Gfo/Idh/MocA family oxidoreductase [Planctomycetota bacterium]|nr:Gfo/Idh/MocA family oxidoreductase [Planctomycetota bacterium]